MLALRVLSALVLLPPVLAATYYGRPYFDVMIALFAVVMAWEWEVMCRGRFTLAGGGLALALLAGTGMLATPWPLLAWGMLVIGGGLLAIWGAGEQRNRARPVRWWLAAGVVYLGVPLVCLVDLRSGAGLETVAWAFLVVWATDIGAYAAGRLVGGPLLAPTISPKKTWSGAIGGVLAAVAVGYGAANVLGMPSVTVLLLASGGVSVVSEIGDLLESGMKRHFGVKDSGNILPGHGGVLDRVDGLLTAVPAVALGVWVAGGGIVLWR
ncbi:MAG: phosphatidate cytidylyltransferase [Alphaproteobacteria bacterium]